MPKRAPPKSEEKKTSEQRSSVEDDTAAQIDKQIAELEARKKELKK